MSKPDIFIWTLWRHHSGRIYRVTGFTNMKTTDNEKFPRTVAYESIDTGDIWSRPVVDFSEKFEPVDGD